MTQALISMLNLLLSLLFLYYGVRLASIYSNNRESGEVKEKKYIYTRVSNNL